MEGYTELNESGLVEFGSHTMDHRDINRLSMAEIEKEIIESKNILEKTREAYKALCLSKGNL